MEGGFPRFAFGGFLFVCCVVVLGGGETRF